LHFFRYLLQLINAPPNLYYPKGYNRTSGKSNTSQDVVKQMFKEISDEDIKKLLEVYSVDYELFGYDYPDLR